MFIVTDIYGKKITSGSMQKCLKAYYDAQLYYYHVVWEIADGKAVWVRGG